MNKTSLHSLRSITISMKFAVTNFAAMLTIIIIDLITARRILPYNNTSEDILFVTIIVITSTCSFF